MFILLHGLSRLKARETPTAGFAKHERASSRTYRLMILLIQSKKEYVIPGPGFMPKIGGARSGEPLH
jgi:hypothetical protein